MPVKVAAAICEVQTGTIRQWVSRGLIVRYPDGYEITELLLWLEQTRKTQMIRDSCGTTPEPYTEVA